MNFNDMLNKAKTKKKILSVACPEDYKVLKACVDAFEENICTPIFVGNKEKIQSIANENNLDISNCDIIDENDKVKACEISVKLVSQGNAHFLMKGQVDTSILLKAVLNKEWGLRTGRLLSHIALFEIEGKYHKPFIVTDGGMNIKPDLKTKIDIIKNAIDFYNRFGVEKPKVAVLAAIEKVNKDMEETMEAALLAKMGDRKQINAYIDGPLAFDLAISKESANIKGVKSDVAGDADILVVPDIVSGNILAKTLIYMTDCKIAGIVVGAKCPIILLSRSDNEITKKMSIAMAAI